MERRKEREEGKTPKMSGKRETEELSGSEIREGKERRKMALGDGKRKGGGDTEVKDSREKRGCIGEGRK